MWAPGGSAAAHYLAKHGLDVLLLDKASFPRDKTCGDALTPRALAVLDEMELLNELLRIGRRINSVEIVSPRGDSVAAPLPKTAGWAVPDLLTSDEWMHLTKEAGFCDMQFTDITFNVRPSLNRLYQLSKVWRPIAVALFVLGLISDLHYANWRGARNQWHALERRLWIMGTLTASKP